MAKTEYSLIEMEIVEFDAEDVITTSPGTDPVTSETTSESVPSVPETGIH